MRLESPTLALHVTPELDMEAFKIHVCRAMGRALREMATEMYDRADEAERAMYAAPK